MSRRANCWDNAVVESFFHTLKTELVHHRRYRTRAEAKHDIFEWLEAFSNRVRRHSTLGYRSPAEFEAMAIGPSLSVHEFGGRSIVFAPADRTRSSLSEVPFQIPLNGRAD